METVIGKFIALAVVALMLYGISHLSLVDEHYAYCPDTRILHITRSRVSDPRYERRFLTDEEHIALLDWLKNRPTYINS